MGLILKPDLKNDPWFYLVYPLNYNPILDKLKSPFPN